MITAERLHELVTYDPVTGIFRHKRGGHGRRVGDIAGSTKQDGYIAIRLDRRDYLAHRLAFLYMTGKWPKEDTDHKNLIKSDNRWENLREATPTQNGANRGRFRNNKSGYKGVCYHRGTGRYQAAINPGGRCVYLGQYDTREEAQDAYIGKSWEVFGEFARAS